jgi:hypothetical protein
MMVLFEKVEQNFDNHLQMGIEARTTFLSSFSMQDYCDSFSKIIL